eukprot:g1040.t1
MRVSQVGPPLVLFFVLAVVGQQIDLARADDSPNNSGDASGNVPALSFSNFMSTLETNNNVLVEFYAPWCGHCKKLLPEFEEAAAQLKEEKVDILLAKVDAIEEDMLKGFFSINAFPAIKFFQNGKAPIDYNGGRTAVEIYKWSYAAATAYAQGRTMKDVLEEAAVKAKQQAAKAQKKEQFQSVMKSLPKLPKKEKKLDSRPQEEAAPIAQKEAEASAKIVTEGPADDLPPVLSFPSRTLLRLLNREISIKGDTRIVFLIWKAESENSVSLGKRFDEIAETHRRKCLFIGIDSEDSHALKYFKIPRHELPAARAIDYTSQEQRFKMNVDTLEADTAAFLSKGGLPQEPYYTAPMAKKWSMAKTQDSSVAVEKVWFQNAENMATVTGDNFLNTVISEQKDVLVMVYADWCTHCQTLKPKFLNLAKKLNYVSTLKFAAMNGDTNEVHGLDVKAFPEIYLFPAFDKDKAVAYDGPREEGDILAFLQKKASHMFTVREGHDEL